MYQLNNTTELSSLEETHCQFNGGTGVIKLGIDVDQDFYVVVEQVGGSNPKPPQRFRKRKRSKINRNFDPPDFMT
jgi:hypothetical protein